MKQSVKTPKIIEYLQAHPEAKPPLVAAKLGVHPSLVYKVRKSLRATIALDTSSPDTSATLIVPPGQAEILSLLEDRGSRYGKFKDHAQVTQELKRLLTRHAHATERTFTDSQWEALEMICHKIGRIVNGDPNYIDSWADIAGYAQLVADELKGIER